MSASTAKATRRDMRRAVGEVVTGSVMEQGDLLRAHDALLERHSRLLASLINEVATLQAAQLKAHSAQSVTLW